MMIEWLVSERYNHSYIMNPEIIYYYMLLLFVAYETVLTNTFHATLFVTKVKLVYNKHFLFFLSVQ